MIQLYGLRLSNYYNLTKALLLEKGLEFEEIKAPPSQKDDNLARSPAGRMPSIGVDGSYMSETLAIATYLDRLQPEPLLIPADPFAAGKVLELVCHIKLDVELVARRCLPEALFNQPVSDEVKEATKKDLVKGMGAVNRIFVGEPYAAGPDLTLADFYTYFSFGLAGTITENIFGIDLLEGHDNIRDVMSRMAERPSVQQVDADAAA